MVLFIGSVWGGVGAGGLWNDVVPVQGPASTHVSPIIYLFIYLEYPTMNSKKTKGRIS
jgi:hypothetical protein